MRKFILNILLFSIIFICLVGVGEAIVRHIPNDYSVKDKMLSNKSPFIKILCLGNSQMYFGVNPAFFEKRAFNAAHVSEPLNISQFILNKYDAQLDSLETLIISISFFTPFGIWETGGEGESWRIKHYHLYYGYPIPWYDMTDRFELSNSNYKTLVRWKKAFTKSNGIVYSDSCGFGRDYTQHHPQGWDQCENAIRAHTTENFAGNPNIEINRDILVSIIKQHPHCNIFLLTTPCWHTYTDNVNKEQLQFVEDFANNIADSFNNCYYINLFTDDRFDAEDFDDAYHLSVAGAQKLTLILNDTIQRYAN